ncbi:MAG: M1 family aminopeptidase, partial [Deltaproteobacteria bacterium]
PKACSASLAVIELDAMRIRPLFVSCVASSILAACGGHQAAVTSRASARPVAPVASLAPASSTAPVPAPRADGRLPDTARPQRYTLALDIDPSHPRYGGTVRIDVEIPRATGFVVMHARGITVRSASITPAGGAAIPAMSSLRASVGGRGTPEELVLAATREVPAGRAQVEILFDREFDTGLHGLYRVRAGEDWYAYTQMEPNDARRAFPCFDEPSYKVPWELSLSIPTGLVAVANMPEAGHADDSASHHTTVRFVPTPPTPSYLVALAVGPFDVVQGATSPVPIRAITTRGQGHLTASVLAAAADHVRILGEYFDRTFPYPKLDLVAVPEFGAGAMENPGMITFREELMLLDPEHAPTTTRRAMASVLAHELAHHWFGDLVTMAWWNDLWLNEGFATWAQARVVDQWRPDFDGRIDALRSRGYAMELDALPAARAVRQPVTTTSEAMEAFDGITYTKGGAVLRMLELWLGEDAFRAGVRQYIHAHEWGNATAQDLLDALGTASHQDVAGVAATFLDQPGVPLVQVDLDCAHGAPGITLTQSQYLVPSTAASASPAPAATPRRWRIPVCIAFEQGGHALRQCTVLADERATVPLAGATRCPQWIQPNADESAYYRYAITPPVMALTTRAGLRTLDVRGRIGLLDDAWAMVRSARLGLDAYLSLVDGFRGERDRSVIETLLGAFGEIYTDAVSEADRRVLALWIGDFLRPIARELGWDARPGDTDDHRLLRRAVLHAMGSLVDDPIVHAEAERRTQAYLRDPRAVEPDVMALALPLASRHAGAERFTALVTALAHPRTPADRMALISALGQFGDPTVMRRALDATLTDAVRLQDTLRLVYTAWGHPLRRAAVAMWIHEHYDALRSRLPEESMGYLGGIVGGTCTPESLAAERAFFEPRLAAIEGAERGLREAIDRAEQCIAFRAREGERLHAFLARAGGRRR